MYVGRYACMYACMHASVCPNWIIICLAFEYYGNLKARTKEQGLTQPLAAHEQGRLAEELAAVQYENTELNETLKESQSKVSQLEEQLQELHTVVHSQQQLETVAAARAATLQASDNAAVERRQLRSFSDKEVLCEKPQVAAAMSAVAGDVVAAVGDDEGGDDGTVKGAVQLDFILTDAPASAAAAAVTDVSDYEGQQVDYGDIDAKTRGKGGKDKKQKKQTKRKHSLRNMFGSFLRTTSGGSSSNGSSSAGGGRSASSEVHSSSNPVTDNASSKRETRLLTATSVVSGRKSIGKARISPKLDAVNAAGYPPNKQLLSPPRSTAIGGLLLDSDLAALSNPESSEARISELEAALRAAMDDKSKQAEEQDQVSFFNVYLTCLSPNSYRPMNHFFCIILYFYLAPFLMQHRCYIFIPLVLIWFLSADQAKI